MMNKRVTLNRKLSVSRLTGLIGLLAIVLVAAFFTNALPSLGVRAQSSPDAVAPSLGTASTFGVLAATTVTNTGLSTVNGNLGVSPGTAVTGFPPGVVVGTIFTGAGSVAGQAQLDATVAYNNLAGQACNTILTGQDLGGLVLRPGVYCFSSSAFLTGILTLDGQGDPNAVFVFKIGSTLVTASAAQVVLINGAQACNVFFQVGSSATLGTGTRFQGNILALTSITVTTGTNLNGRAIALNGAVTLDTNMITNCVSVPPQPTPTPTPTPTPPPPTPTPTPPTQQTCVPTTTVTEGDLFPGGLASFTVTSGPGSVTVDHVNAGTGLRSFTVVNATNAVVSIPPFTPGTFAPVTATYTVPNPSQPIDFTLRAASLFHSIFIRVRCAETCTPSTTVTEGDLFPGGLASFGVTSGTNSVTVDHVNLGTGLRSFTVVSATNAIVNIPAFTPGTFDPVTATYTVTNPNLPFDITLRAASLYHSIFIRIRCITSLHTFSGEATAVKASNAVGHARLVETGLLPATGGLIIAPPLSSANVLGGALRTGLLNANTQGAGEQSRSQAIAENLNLMVDGNTITSNIVAESSQCTCTTGGPICEGSFFGNLSINGVQIAITGLPNQRVNLPVRGFITINEQMITGGGVARQIKANGLRIFVPGDANADISSADSKIVCSPQ